MNKIILASQSPRRKQLLDWAEIKFEVVAADVDESFSADQPIYEVPVSIAKKKATAVAAIHPDAIIIAADTVVVLEGEIIGKPKDREDAIHILTKLAGREHQVITGVVLLNKEKEIAFSDTTAVRFHPLSSGDIEFYVEKYQPYDKAGAYAIQEWIGVVGIHSIRGDFYNVMGLPVSRVVKALKELV